MSNIQTGFGADPALGANALRSGRKEEVMVKAERSKTGPYPAKDLDRVFTERMLKQGMAQEDIDGHIDRARAMAAAKNATKQ